MARSKSRRADIRRPAPARPAAIAWHPWLWYAVLVTAVFVVYRPVWHGGLLWDDDAHLIAEPLRSWGGLARLWTELSLSQQYYPVAGSAFWLLARISSGTFGYHAANILLHATSAFLVTTILRRLKVPGALIAGAIFALHPINVESVAWISELKNTLSGACYLGALLAYLRFDESRTTGRYVTAFVLFLLALGSKTVTGTLPAAVLLIFWWRRGALEWRRDVVPLLPFFATGIAAGLGTAWLEYHWVGAHGARFDLSLLERILLSGRVVWFYAWKILWPSNLMFNYPRWNVDAAIWWQYLFLIALAATLAGLFLIRGRTRTPLAAALYFIGTLFPVLGLFNVYPFRFSFVADHFQYLASLGLIAALSAGLIALVNRWRPGLSESVVAVVIALPLGIATHQYSRYFTDAETLYRETIARNPASVLAHGHLASRLLDGPAAGWPEAMAHARAMLDVDPNSVAGHNLLGLALQRSGRLSEALPELQRALALDPGLAEGHFNLGLALDGLGRPDEAIAAYRRSLDIYPHNVKALHNLANVLRGQKRFGEALAVLRRAIEIDPDSADVKLNFADTLQASGDFAGAIAAYQDALGRRPDWGEAWNNLGNALRRTGRLAEARQAFETAARLLPDAPLVFINLGSLYAQTGDTTRAITAYERALILVPDAPTKAQIQEQLRLLKRP